MRPDDHHVEPLFAGLGHEHERDEAGGAARAERPRGDPTLKWKLLAVVVALGGLVWLLSWQAF